MAPASGPHGSIANRIAYFLTDHVLKHGLGEVFAAETGYRSPEQDGRKAKPSVRAPDVSFVPTERVAIAQRAGFVETAPDLVVEVFSPSDRAGEVGRKTLWWLKLGVLEVWNVDPMPQTVTVTRADGSARLYQMGEEAESVDALPGFRLDLERVFPS